MSLSELPLVTGNEVQLQQVILNLVMNATESMCAFDPIALARIEGVADRAVRKLRLDHYERLAA
jgi:C4-dicarboxylate-specific signal transduction histidine kinase